MADEKIDLPDGGWAVLRDPRRVTERAARPVNRLQERLTGSKVGAVFMEKNRRDAAGLSAEETDKWFTEECRKLLGTDDYELLDELNDAAIPALVDSWSYESPVSLDAAMALPRPVFKALRAACAKHVVALTSGLDTSPADEKALTDPASPTGPSAG